MTETGLDHLDRLLLNAVQSDFPVEARPYAVLAERLNRAAGLSLTEEEVQARLLALRHRGIIRRLGAVFNARDLGYQSTLCAARVPADKLAVFQALTGQAPQITHNYLRDGEINAWFTFTSRRPEELDEFLKRLGEAAGLAEILVLDAEKVFKIKADFKFRAD
ncbi:MAG: Lrp/AsnC family transcriptional regulator [Candidatus Adiutrix sp.]|jgi:DNA-binding Lrp family transcriptional regulator|nr:Lrp/AsnC family transcriptional regulator [Candidatus Adiutrix sp.]